MGSTFTQSASAQIARSLGRPRARWDFITCEFPPKVGGVSDYSRQLAEALAQRGAEVEVWAPGVSSPETPFERLTIRREFNRFRPRDLLNVSRIWKTAGVHRNIFLQWVPNGYGYNSLNIFVCLWLAAQVAQGHRLSVMFHEVAYSLSQPKLRLKVAGLIHRAMALMLVACSREVFVSTWGIAQQLRKYNVLRRDIKVLPVPSNIPECTDLKEACAIRSALIAPGEILIGHFGLYSPGMERILVSSLNALLNRNPRMKVILIGNGSELYRSKILAKYPDLEFQVLASGSCDSSRISAYISACDCLFQPYPDGLTTKRTTAMAALANGKLLISTASAETKEVWKATSAVCLIYSVNPLEIAEEVDSILSTPHRLLAGAAEAKRFYQENFAVDRTVTALEECVMQ
jgi:glycosyltransferase involved in cell wall biosynthesis